VVDWAKGRLLPDLTDRLRCGKSLRGMVGAIGGAGKAIYTQLHTVPAGESGARQRAGRGAIRTGLADSIAFPSTAPAEAAPVYTCARLR